jgi:hypothetical protein
MVVKSMLAASEKAAQACSPSLRPRLHGRLDGADRQRGGEEVAGQAGGERRTVIEAGRS